MFSTEPERDIAVNPNRSTRLNPRVKRISLSTLSTAMEAHLQTAGYPAGLTRAGQTARPRTLAATRARPAAQAPRDRASTRGNRTATRDVAPSDHPPPAPCSAAGDPPPPPAEAGIAAFTLAVHTSAEWDYCQSAPLLPAAFGSPPLPCDEESLHLFNGTWVATNRTNRSRESRLTGTSATTHPTRYSYRLKLGIPRLAVGSR